MKKRQLTKEQRDGELGFKLMEDIKKGVTASRMGFLHVIEAISEIDEKQLYKDILGDEDAKLLSLLGQVEIYISRSTIIQHLRARTRLKELGYEYKNMHQIPAERIIHVARFAKDKNHAEELFGQAKVLLSREWSDELHKLSDHPTFDDGHEHRFKKYKQCEYCGRKQYDERQT